MIYVIDPTAYELYPNLVDQMYEVRAQQFYDRRKWRVVVRDGREIDEFDEMGPVYVINADEYGRVIGSLRLLPSTGPHMLSDVFHDLMDGEKIVRHPLIWESSRFNINSRWVEKSSSRSVNKATSELLIGLFELAHSIGLRQLVSVYDLAVGRILKRAGCDIVQIGKVVPFDGLPTAAGLFEVGEHVVQELRRKADIHGPVIATEPPKTLSLVA